MNNSTTLLALVNGFRLVVRANRFGCDTDFAREVHDKLITHLEEAAEVLLQRNEPRFTDFYLEGDAVPLVDYLHVDHATKEWRSPEGDWYFLDGREPQQIDVTDERLGGLRSILKRIRQETGIAFSAYELQD
ncbi:hypothetical protein EDF68_11431 [Ochrobactrum sp. BH3]|nr:hypothetical protein EDF68_11431 [Ochrobactrum sp. BH3]